MSRDATRPGGDGGLAEAQEVDDPNHVGGEAGTSQRSFSSGPAPPAGDGTNVASPLYDGPFRDQVREELAAIKECTDLDELGALLSRYERLLEDVGGEGYELPRHRVLADHLADATRARMRALSQIALLAGRPAVVGKTGAS